MAMNFGKGNRSIAFNPTSAFPLDARSYFESYSEAVAAAARAEAAGSTSTEYYFGQTLVVVENDKASFYIIQPNKTLSPITSAEESGEEKVFEVNVNQFEFDANGALVLKGSKEAPAGALVSIDNEGNLIWVDPIDAYTKDETDRLIELAIANAPHMKRKIVANVAEIEAYINEHDDADQYIFMIPTGFEEESDKYDEYLVITVTDADNVTTKFVEKIGSWEVNLEDYAKTVDVNAALAKKVSVDANARLMTLDEANKLAALLLGAEKNVINSVSSDFAIDDNRQLTLNNISISKVTDLQDLLNTKVDARSGYTLLSPTDKAKLDALTLDSNNQLEISSKVNAANVEGLADWLSENAATTPGLSQNNLDDGLYSKLVASLLIKSVDTNELSVSNGKLNIAAVDSSKVTGLIDALNEKAAVATVNALDLKVDNIAKDLNALTLRVDDQDLVIATLSDRLTWKNI